MLAAALGLAGILAATKTDLPKRAGDIFSNAIDDAIYDQNVTSQKYEVIDHRIQKGDILQTLVGGNKMAVDYAIAINPGLNLGKLKPGKYIRIPVLSKNGNGYTIPELFSKFYSTPK